MIGPLLVGALAALAALRKPEEPKEMSGKLRHTLQMALSSSKLTAAQYRELAGAFEQGGWTVESALLRKRAVLRELPEDLRKKRADLFRKGLGSADAEAVEELALAFEEEGATGSAKTLREHALALRHAKEVPEAGDYEAGEIAAPQDFEVLEFQESGRERAPAPAPAPAAEDSPARPKANGALSPSPEATPFDATHPDPMSRA